MGYPWSACSFARLFAFFNRTKHNVIIVFIVVVSCGSSQPCHKYDYTLKEKTKRQNKRLLCERVCVHLFVMCASCIFFFYFLFFCIFVMFLWFFSGVSLGFVVKFSILHVSFMSFFKGFFFWDWFGWVRFGSICMPLLLMLSSSQFWKCKKHLPRPHFNSYFTSKI